jgi:hypothetical protein
MTEKQLLKVLRIIAIMFIAVMFVLVYLAYAGELGKSPRQIYNDNRRIEHEGGVHTTKPYRVRKKRKVVRKCYEITNGVREKVPCPEPELEEGVEIIDGRVVHE